MADTPRTIAYLLASVFQDGQGDGSMSAQDIRDMIVTLAPKHCELYHSADQAIVAINTSQVIIFDTEVVLDGFTHSNGVITVSEAIPDIDIVLEIEVKNGSGSNTFTVWMEVNLLAGGGWVPFVASGEKVTLSTNDESVISLDRSLYNLVVGDKIQFRCQASSINMFMDATVASGDIPLIPSVHLHISKS